MEISEKSKIIPFQLNPPTEEELISLHIPSQYQKICEDITKINGTYYYFKRHDNIAMINELIGSYLSRLIGLDTVDYELSQFHQFFLTLSKVFYEEKYCYKDAKRFLLDSNSLACNANNYSFFDPIYHCRTGNLRLFRGSPLCEDILKLTAVDLKMGQCDRHGKNLQVKIDSVGNVTLASVYDYGCAYRKDVDSIFYEKYANPFLVVRRNPLSLKSLFYQYPELWEYVQLLETISIEDVLGAIEDLKGITFTGEEREYYHQEQKDIDAIINKAKIKRFF